MRGDFVDQRQIDALVDHAGVSEPRMRNAAVLLKSSVRRRACTKCEISTPLGNGWTLRMKVPFRLEQTDAAGEHQVRYAQKLLFKTLELRGSAAETWTVHPCSRKSQAGWH